MRAKIVSSLEKCFLDEQLTPKPELSQASMLKNERYSFQVCYDVEEPIFSKEDVSFYIESVLTPFITVYMVKHIPSSMPAYPTLHDANYLRTEPGLFPDLLEPMPENRRLVAQNALNTLWLELDPRGAVEAGTYPICCYFTNPAGQRVAECTLQMQIIPASLPEQKLTYTQWFYTDCLMQYYNTEAFDERHWQIIENFMVNTHKYGVNMILTPILTPELDTYEGGERPTTQLVDITKTPEGYSFDFSRLGRWVDLCDKVGIRYLEINHFFTQWGAKACPKVIAKVDGVETQIFGWDTKSDGDEYKEFLYALIPAMLSYLKEEKNGADKRCYFHISDEPYENDLELYTKLSNMLKPLLKGYPIMDAISHYEYYENGAITCPVPLTTCTGPFIENKVPNLWTYYCCVPATEASNRFFSMPAARTRIIGTQFYKYEIAGFLHWGYNFYNTQISYATINPFVCSDGEGFAPSGDTYSVYPGKNGQPWPSLRQVVFYDAIQDQMALQLCQELYGREYTMALLEKDIDPITFTSYPRSAAYLLDLRQRVNAAIAAKVSQ